MNTSVRTEHLAAFAIGLAIALPVARIGGWWLDSGRSVGIAMAALFGLGFVAARWKLAGRRERTIALWAGIVAGMAVQLFVVGPGTIWPLALVMGGVMAAVAVLAGTAVASMFDRS